MRTALRPVLLLSALIALALSAAAASPARAQPLRADPPDPFAAVGRSGALQLDVGLGARFVEETKAVKGEPAAVSPRTDLGFFVAIGGRFDVIVDKPASPAPVDRGFVFDGDRLDDGFLDDGFLGDGLLDPASGRGAKRAPKKAAPPEEGDPTPPAEPPAPAVDPAPAPRVLGGKMARGLVRAALHADRSAEKNERLDGLASRARASALLPEVRVRVGHDVGQGEALSPTEYDPDRVTATGSTSLWVEGRATFRLDRLVFADDEVQIERMRADRAKEDRALTDRVLGLVGAWQSAEVILADAGLVDPDVRAKAEVARLGAEAALDVLTDGYFSAHVGELRASR